MATENKAQVCSNCNHFRKTSFTIGCGLGKWDLKSQTEVFFHNPDSFYWDDDIERRANLSLWENGVLCKKYDGNDFLITHMSVSVEAPESFDLMNGQRFSVESSHINYDITIREINAILPGEITANLRIPEESGSNLMKWFRTVTL